MNIFKSAVVALLTISLFFNAYAAPQKITLHKPPTVERHYILTDKDGTKSGIIDIQGEIDETTVINVESGFAEFESAHINYIMIHLNSQGGLVSSGSKIGLAIIHSEDSGNKVATLVGDGDLCASMCTGVFALGQVRVAGKTSIWIFHSPYIKESLFEEIFEFIIPGASNDAKEAQEWSRQTILAMYGSADPIWAANELKDYVYSDNGAELILYGATIPKHGLTYVTNLY